MLSVEAPLVGAFPALCTEIHTPLFRRSDVHIRC
jgi:hypothetical protein